MKQRHALRVLNGGLSREERGQDDRVTPADAARLAEEIAEAARLCDRLEADGLRVAFELDGERPGVRVSVRDDQGHDLQRVALSDATDMARLGLVSGIAS